MQGFEEVPAFLLADFAFLLDFCRNLRYDMMRYEIGVREDFGNE